MCANFEEPSRPLRSSHLDGRAATLGDTQSTTIAFVMVKGDFASQRFSFIFDTAGELGSGH
jgi:hypothetical protein